MKDVEEKLKFEGCTRYKDYVLDKPIMEKIKEAQLSQTFPYELILLEMRPMEIPSCKIFELEMEYFKDK